uniref:Zmp:0000001139 n=1 Tax=Cyprinus carpio carpio TaxID=630221 RepID=A0A8C1FGF6_CYPCA
MERFKIFLLTVAVSVQVKSQDSTTEPPVQIPKPQITLNVAHKVLYKTERVTLSCEVTGGPPGLQYDWYKNSEDLGEHQHNITASDSGKYECKATKGAMSEKSDSYTLTLEDPPQPQVRSDWTEAFHGEKVSLQCVIQASENWNYMWFKGQNKIVSNDETNIQGNTLTLSVQSSHDGEYVCQAVLQDRKVTTSMSTPYSLTVRELPQPKLSVESQWKTFYPTEKVTLKCSVKEDSDKWGYEWFRNGAPLPKDKDKDISLPGNTLSISSAKAVHSGQYTCRGRHLKRTPVTTGEAEAVQLHVNDNTPKPTITKHEWFEPFYSNEQAQLHCNMPGDGWEYHWYKGTNLRITNPELTIDSVSVTDTGVYHCKAQRGDFSVNSETLQVTVKDPPQPQVRSDWTEAFHGEKVSLQCVIQASENWNYMWFKGQNKIVSNDETNIQGNTLTLSVQSSHDGEYVCQAELQGRKVTTSMSTPYSLTVRELPQLKLSVESQWKTFYPTEKVTLKCSVKEDSDKWGYEWFRNGAPLPKDKDKDISLPGNTLSISSAKAVHSGQYTCRGRHLKRTPVTTGQAEAVQLHVNDTTPKAAITKREWFELFYTEERVQLHCNMSGVGWKYHWYKGTNPPIINPELTINSVSHAHTGDYHCKAQRGDFSVNSKTLQVRVQARPPASLTLETELSDIMTGDMTLRCNITDGRQWNYTWFMNGQQLNESSNVLKVAGNEETIKSEFKCKGRNVVRPLYSALSDGFIANNIIFKRKILLAISGCLVCCIVILIIGCIVLKITRKPEVKETPHTDLFFSMTDSKNQTASPMKEYIDSSPTELEELQEKEELITDRTSVVHEDGVIKDEETPASEANGLTSFKGR